jgi:cell division protein FtsL
MNSKTVVKWVLLGIALVIALYVIYNFIAIQWNYYQTGKETEELRNRLESGYQNNDYVTRIPQAMIFSRL